MREAPLIAPGSREEPAVELRTVLHIVKQGHLAGGIDQPTDSPVDKGRDESGELQLGLGAIFHEVLIGVALQTADGLVGTTQLDAQHLATTKQVAVLISQRGRSAQVARRIRTFRLETQRRGLVVLQEDLAIQRVGIRHLLKGDIRIFHGLQASEVVIRILQTGGGIRTARMQVRALLEHMLAEVNLVITRAAATVIDMTHPVTRMRHIFLVGQLIRRQMQRQVDKSRMGYGISLIGDIVLMKTVIAGI